MLSIRSHIRIIVMVAILILAPIILSVLATQYESCKFIKKGCVPLIHPPDYVEPSELNKSLDEVVCGTSGAVYKDLNSGKCYGFPEPLGQVGSSPPPPNARLVWIGSDRNK